MLSKRLQTEALRPAGLRIFIFQLLRMSSSAG